MVLFSAQVPQSCPVTLGSEVFQPFRPIFFGTLLHMFPQCLLRLPISKGSCCPLSCNNIQSCLGDPRFIWLLGLGRQHAMGCLLHNLTSIRPYLVLQNITLQAWQAVSNQLDEAILYCRLLESLPIQCCAPADSQGYIQLHR